MIRILAVVLALVCAAPALAQAPKLPPGANPAHTLVIDTTQGRIVIALRTDLAPHHAARLEQLARDGFYNNVPFHRVMAGFMAQTGDGQNHDGTGHSKYPNIKAEFTATPFLRGVVGMARANDPNSANSQFFICLGDASFLNGQYTVIGTVISGMNVVDKLKKAPPGSQSGTVSNPDKMLKVQVASDMK
jgi:peptidylprolyl isomerase